MAASDQERMEEGSGGSWLPLVVIFVVLFFRWAAYGQGNVPIRMRRWYNLQVGNEKIFERRPFEVYTSCFKSQYGNFSTLLFSAAPENS
jgi:hypothetical protein